MALLTFLAFCILGCQFLIYALFQWMYGDKSRPHFGSLREEEERALRPKLKLVRSSRLGKSAGLPRSEAAARDKLHAVGKHYLHFAQSAEGEAYRRIAESLRENRSASH